jgi:NAD(P)-dependent dehydrogenase (short-subunit alcohol dehydrogenase family)
MVGGFGQDPSIRQRVTLIQLGKREAEERAWHRTGRRTLGDDYERLMDRRATWTPMKRNLTVADVAETIFSLITSNPFVTGETIVIDGGYAATS